MRGEPVKGLPPRPESVAEWEDLLVRLEIVPRVVRNEVEDAASGEEGRLALMSAVRREAAVGLALEAAAGLEASTGSGVEEEAEAEALALRFASLRARTFAMVQRRGLEVWDWTAPLEEGGSATVHQLLLWLAARDAELLASLRDTTRPGPVAC
jgi:predicted aminopeptidase